MNQAAGGGGSPGQDTYRDVHTRMEADMPGRDSPGDD